MDELRAGREMDAACARAMDVSPDYAYPQNEGDPVFTHFPYSTDHNAARLLEDEIERRGLVDKYTSALLIEIDSDTATWDIIDGSEKGGGWVDRAFLFKFARATPEQRARAFLKVVAE